jgi:MFS family permease
VPSLRGLTRSTAYLALASFFADVSTELLYPVLPLFLTQSLGAGGAVVGLVEGAAEATQSVVQGFSGWLSDTWGTRKPLALAGYTVAALAKPLIGVSTAWPAVLGARLLDRFGTGVRSAPRDALVAASAADSHRGKAFGLEGFGDNLGACVGPLIGVVLLTRWHVALPTIFYASAAPGLAAVCMIALVHEGRTRVNATAKLDASARRLPAAYWRYLIVVGIFSAGNSSNSFLILQTRDIGASLSTTILTYAAFNLVAAAASYPAGSLSDRLGRRNVLAFALVVFTAAYVGFGSTKHVGSIASCFVVYGVYQGIFRSVGKALATDLVPASFRASGVGWYTATTGLLGLVASIVAGQLWDRVGHAAVFFYGAATAAVAAVGLFLLLPMGSSRPANRSLRQKRSR